MSGDLVVTQQREVLRSIGQRLNAATGPMTHMKSAHPILRQDGALDRLEPGGAPLTNYSVQARPWQVLHNVCHNVSDGDPECFLSLHVTCQ